MNEKTYFNPDQYSRAADFYMELVEVIAEFYKDLLRVDADNLKEKASEPKASAPSILSHQTRT